MATRAELEKALRNADKAGDSNAARIIARELGNMPANNDQPAPLSVSDQFAQEPWYSKLGIAADDILRLASNGVTFGFRDKFANLVGGDTPEHERKKTEEAAQRSGLPGQIAEAGGALLVPGLATENMAGGVLTKLMGRLGLSVGEGGVMGGLSALGHDENIPEGVRTGMVYGPLAELGVRTIAGGTNKIADAFNPKFKRPSLDELNSDRIAAADSVAAAKARVRSTSVDRLKQDIADQLANFQLDDIAHPKASKKLRQLSELNYDPDTGKARSVPLSKLELFTQSVNRDLKNELGSEDTIPIFNNTIDAFLKGVNSKDIHFSKVPADEGVDRILRARDTKRRYENSQRVEDAIGKATRRAARSEGHDVTGAIRANADQLMGNKAAMSTMNPEESAAVRDIVMGTREQNMLADVGRLSPSIGLIHGGAAAGIGGLVGSFFGPVGAKIGAVALPTVGYAAKKASDNMMKKSADALMDTVAVGRKIRRPTNAVQDAIGSSKDRIARLLSLMAINANQRQRS